MEKKLIIVRHENRIVSSLFEGNALVQLNIEPFVNDSAKGQSKILLGNIYLGKVKNIVKNINAAFVEIADGTMCYLSLDKNENPIFSNAMHKSQITVGDELIVQVIKENIKTKAPVVTVNINITGKYAVLTHGKTATGISAKIENENARRHLKRLVSRYQNKEYGFILRTNAVEADDDAILYEMNHLIEVYESIKQYGIHKSVFSLLYQTPAGYICDIRDGYTNSIHKIMTDDVYLYGEMKEYLSSYQREDLDKLVLYEDPLVNLSTLFSIRTKLEESLREKVWLKSGGSLIIQPTEALTVIDVNTGKAIEGRKKVQETFFKINMEAAKEIARQIRLRNLSGIIIIDFIDMLEEEKRLLLMNELRLLFAKDPIKTTLVDMTALNLVEVTRKKVRKPLHEQII